MQKGEWLPFSLLFSFCILHFHSWGQRGSRSPRERAGLRGNLATGLTLPPETSLAPARPSLKTDRFAFWRALLYLTLRG